MDIVWVGPEPLGDDPAALLAALQTSQAVVRAEEATQIEAAARFARAHTPAASDAEPEEIDEFAVVEFAAVAGMSLDSGRAFLLDAVELVTRLPRTWARVRAGEVAGWRGRRIAETTWQLPAAGAAWVDAEVAGRADKIGPAKLEQISRETAARFDPEAAIAEVETALDERTVGFYPDGPVTHLAAVLDPADAADLDAALSTIAADLDGEEPLQVRRSRALGMLARGEPTQTDFPTAPSAPSREVVLHVHLVEDESIAQVRSHTGRTLGHPGSTGITSIDQVREWCHDAGKVVIKPVIDPAATLTSSGYSPSARIRDHVTEIDQTCVFPWCHRPAGNLDLDHIVPYDPGGPPGQTTTANLAALCRRHHRAKTFTGWTYHQIAPGEFLWTSIYGWRFLRTPDGTTDLGRSGHSRAA
jgi:hypothetical protein